jgi:hypothetical protein
MKSCSVCSLRVAEMRQATERQTTAGDLVQLETHDERLIVDGQGSLLLVAHSLAERVLVNDLEASLVTPLLEDAR